MIVAEELIEEYKERYEVDRLKAIKMVLEDLRLAEKELQVLGAKEMLKGGSKSDGETD